MKLKNFFLFLLIITFLSAPALADIPKLELNCVSAILINLETGNTMFELDADLKRYPASLTKIMTALVSLENAELSDIIEVTAETFKSLGSYSSTSGLLVGEQLTLEQMLCCLMIPSGNDAANALAIHISGSVENFADLMNKKADSLGLKNTHFVNPHGLHDENHYTTARDMSVLTIAAMENETFERICNLTSYTLTPNSVRENDFILRTTNRIILDKDPNFYPYASGIKTGFTTPAGNCLVSSAFKNEKHYLSVVLGAPTGADNIALSFAETKKMFEWGFNNFKYFNILAANTPVGEVKVNYAQKTDSIIAIVNEDLRQLMPADFDAEAISLTNVLPEDIDAPVTKGQVLGSVTVTYKGEMLGTIPLVAQTQIDRSNFLYSAAKIKAFFLSPIMLGIFSLILVLLIAYITISVIVTKKKKIKK